MMRRSAIVVSVGAIFALVLAVAVTHMTSAISNQFYDDRAYSNDGDVVQGGANISGVVGSNQYVRRASVNFNAYFSGRTGQIQFQNFNFCPGVGGDNGTGNTFANGGNVTSFTVKYFRKNGSNPRQAIDASFSGKKNSNCGATKTINVNFGNSLDPDPDTGRYVVTVSVTQQNAPANGEAPHFNIQNMFRASASSSSGSARIAHKGSKGTDDSRGSRVTVEQTNGGGSLANIDYRVRFGADCSLPKGSDIQKISMYDLDNGGGSGAQLNGKVSLRLQEFKPGSNSGTFVKLSPNKNMSGGGTTITPPSKDNAPQDFWFKANAGRRYVLFINNVYSNNTLQFDTPYDGIFWDTGCAKWDAKAESFVNGGRGWSKLVQKQRGDTVTFMHRVTNTGGVATLDTRPQRNYNDNKVRTGSFNAFDSRRTFTLANGQKKDIQFSFKIPTGRVSGPGSALKAPDGSEFCQRYRINPGSGDGGAENSAKACVRVGTPPAQYDLNPKVRLTGESNYSYYPNTGVEGWVETVGAASGAHTWQMYAVRYDSMPNLATGGDSDATDVCSVVPDDDRASGCELIHNASYSPPPAANSHSMTYTAGGPDDAGTHLCFITRVSNPTEELGDDADWRYSNMVCSVAGAKPKVQVWGGDVKADGEIQTSVVDVRSRSYGSWGEYGVFSNSPNLAMGSGAGLRNPPGIPNSQNDWSSLTFANNGQYGNFDGDLTAPEISSSGVVPIEGDRQISSISEALSWSGGRKKATIVVNGTLTINDSLSYDDIAPSFTSIDQIPRIVLIASNIRIADNVSQIDPWLVAQNGSISTCAEKGFVPLYAAALSSRQCSDRIVFNGPVISPRVFMYRTYDNVDGYPAAETFNLRADNILSSYTGSGSSNPTAVTSSVNEVPPRF